MQRQNKGFTLIELIMVIVILGILAAFALPRFANLQDEAKQAAADGLVGTLKSAKAIAHSKWLVGGETSPITVDGLSITMTAAGYPVATASGMALLIDSDASATHAASVSTFTLNGCTVTYTEAGAAIGAASC